MNQRINSKTIEHLYVQSGLPRDAIARLLDVSHAQVTSSLRQLHVKMRPQRTPRTITELVTSRPLHPRIMMLNGRVVAKHQIKLTLKLAYVLGWILGDGYVNRRETDAIVSARERDFVEPQITHVLQHYGHVFVVPRHGASIIRCNSTLLSRALCSADGRRLWDNIDFVLSLPKFAAAFIAGFWDADGGIYQEATGSMRVHLYNSNLFLLDRIANALQNLYSIETTIYKRKDNAELPDSKIHAQGDRFDLYVPARSTTLWLGIIGRYMRLPWKRPGS
jgi:hypothetical protein